MAEISVEIGTNRVYKDVSLTFAKNPVTSDVLSVTGVDAVKRSIRNILLTRVGEVPFFPEFGTRVHRLLFEPIDPITTALLQSEIQTSIKAFEPRVTVLETLVTPNEEKLEYQIDLTLRLLNQIQPVTLTLFLTRLR